MALRLRLGAAQRPTSAHGGPREDEEHRRGGDDRRRRPGRGEPRAGRGALGAQRLLLGRGPRRLRVLGTLELRGLEAPRRLLDVQAHRRRVGEEVLSAQEPPVAPAHRRRGPRQVRVGALPGEGEVHPLGEQAAVHRHAAAVLRGDLLEALDERCREHPGGRHRRGGELLDDLHDAAREGVGSGDGDLDGPQQRLALVDATHRVELRVCQAIRRRVDVVGDEDARLPRPRLVQGAEITKVLLRLGEHPLALQGRTIELLEGHASRATSLQRHQVMPHRMALAVLPQAVPLQGLLHDERGRREGCARAGQH
mmetsp:Transcript_69271/g.194248  ORF Transcript_69271/g.194248 Transcript_69271/m.194248 type:complete len:310 (-) Transcript_69271:284-1213(-)